MTVALLFGLIILLMTIGVPVAVSLGLSSILFLVLHSDGSLASIAQTLFSAFDGHYTLLAIPFFILTGEVMNRAGITMSLVNFANTLVGHLRGGLAHVNIVTSMLFAGISGSAVADPSAVGSILIPAMIRERYPRAFSAAITGASAVIGAIIPPSIPLIIATIAMHSR